MKKIIAFITFLMAGVPFLMAQDSTATYIENLSVQDSSEIKAQMKGAAEQASSSGSSTLIIVLVVVAVVLVAALLLLRKKQKK